MNYAILLAGGIGNRMRTQGVPKQYVEVNGKPVMMYTLEQMERCPLIDRIIIVAAEMWREQIAEWNAQYHITKHWAFAMPGSVRQISILHGLEVCVKDGPKDGDTVLIHDAVRPLVSVGLLNDCIKTAVQYGGCMPVLPMKDTVYMSQNGISISGLLERNTLYTGQAPEAFRLKEYAQINFACKLEELSAYPGSSQIAYRYGLEVHMIPGEEINFKLTTPEDMVRFREICVQANE